MRAARRAARGALRGRAAAAPIHGGQEHPQDQPDEDEIAHHLHGDEHPGQRADRADVPEAHRREDGDHEIQAVEGAQRLGESTRVAVGEQRVGGGEEQQEQRQGQGDGFQRPQGRMRRAQDRPHLPPHEQAHGQDPGTECGERSGGELAVQRQEEVQDHQAGRCEQRPHDAEEQRAPSRPLVGAFGAVHARHAPAWVLELSHPGGVSPRQRSDCSRTRAVAAASVSRR
jgi:hypothetical protein